jgi:hypothetical protein
MSLSNTDIRYFKLAVGENIGKETDVDISARCPVCGDSSKKSKKRLHLYNKGTVTNVNCFNGDCPVVNKTMYSFLRDFFPDLLNQYKTETFGNKIDNLKNNSTRLKDIIKTEDNLKIYTQDLSPYMLHLKDSDEGIMYLKNRGISYRPLSSGKWYYGTQDLKIGDIVYKITNNIIIPLYYKNEMYGFYSRGIKDKTFITYMDDRNIGYKIWNWFNVNLNEPVYIFEGIFDAISSNKSNVIALLGAKLPEDRLKEMKEPVFCLDNDKTGILNMIEYSKKYKVFVQPKHLKEKDSNELMLNGHNVGDIIDNNIYQGISAITRLKQKL